MKQYSKVRYDDCPLFADVPAEQWNDWRWQLRNVIRDVDTLGRVVELSDERKAGIERCLRRFRMAITPYYAALMDRTYELCSVRLQAIPGVKELEDGAQDLSDPLHEDVDSPVPGLTHRYPDRVLLLVTRVCSMYCRHCTRRRMVGCEDSHLTDARFDAALRYIRDHDEIRDVLELREVFVPALVRKLIESTPPDRLDSAAALLRGTASPELTDREFLESLHAVPATLCELGGNRVALLLANSVDRSLSRDGMHLMGSLRAPERRSLRPVLQRLAVAFEARDADSAERFARELMRRLSAQTLKYLGRVAGPEVDPPSPPG